MLVLLSLLMMNGILFTNASCMFWRPLITCVHVAPCVLSGSCARMRGAPARAGRGLPAQLTCFKCDH